MSTTLTPDEQRYFETGGETLPAEGNAPETPPVLQSEQQQPAEPVTPKEPSTVPHDAFQAERQRRKAAEREQQALRERLARLEGVQQGQQVQQVQQKPPEPSGPPKIPDWNVDPQGHIDGRLQQLQHMQAQLHQDYVQRQQAAQQQRAVQELGGWANAQEQAFKADNADYDAAANFLKENRTQELLALGANELQIQAQLQQDVLQIAHFARQTGANFAQRVYAMAKHRGFGSQAPQSAQTDPSQTAPADQMARQTRGQQFTGLSTGGAAPAQKVTAQTLLEMSPAAFDKFAKDHPEQYRKIMGG